ncbi:LLM class flavin-dependent oxidoreductase [Subtercola frigoramans]|uniref:Alkanesulfonate monooxygenase SsuD/methylene tetrahydromethanopterin reductase-like flavin-dependent oxidoreductase (Luciferase family) n=1 Tax=Subtercola frigoramans TaxID=120298 RepID=A0ABS2L959_9MICO|nr:LLM class flavin-dependent oxidoreductase [Subtercola frigoramans]MBM7473633.1 alkanesulfonate monooxygenase SsuD/methylene tetrahydromethanopterin reductase-like flavin-dependent oxidoreductase (luciferase family) [Subtercola frigoramans]
MKIGMFFAPAHPPERTQEIGGYKRMFDWDISVIKHADELGFEEIWYGEHYTHKWEPVPSPDLVLQTAARETKNIKLGAGTFLPPFHHPAELAARISYQDQLLEGRYLVGFGAGSVPSDLTMFNIDMAAGEHRDMNREAVEVILKYWTEPGPWRHEGKYWTCEKVAADAFPIVPGTLGDHLRPYQSPHPPIAVSGLSPNSPSLEWAGEMGFIPISLNMNNRFMAGHWETVERGAAKTGRTANRNDWRIAREVFVADTDEEALENVRNGFYGRFYAEQLLPVFKNLGGFANNWKHDDSVTDDDLTLEYLIENLFVVGSVETVTRKLIQMQKESGGFGTLLVEAMDYEDRKDAWFHSLELLANEVLPAVNAETENR